MKPSFLSLSAAALSLLGTAACGQIAGDQEEPIHEDPAPLAQCTAYPSCAEGEQEVSKETEGAQAVSICGNTIYCAAQPVQCRAYPTCGPDEFEVPEGTDGATASSICGNTIWCAAKPPVQCAAVPTCNEDEVETDSTTPGAREVTMCGATIWCITAEECPGCGLG